MASVCVFAFHRAGAGDHADVTIAHRQGAGADDRGFGPHFAAGDFVGGQDGDHLGHARPALQRLAELIPLFADGGDDRPFRAVDRMGFQAQLFDALDHVFDLLGGRSSFHDDDHRAGSLCWGWWLETGNKKSPETW